MSDINLVCCCRIY